MTNNVTNIRIAGLGGQGVLMASDILAEAAFLAGYDTKKSEIRGMSRRGGSVATDVRFGDNVLSPMVPPGEADFLVVLDAAEVQSNRHGLREGGLLITPDSVDGNSLENRRALNVALLGILSQHLDIPLPAWQEAIKKYLKPKLHDANLKAFDLGRGEE